MNPLVVVGTLVDKDEQPAGRWLCIWCPGCDELHAPKVAGVNGDRHPGPCWDWNGSVEALTLNPSLLVYGGSDDRRCHSFIREGRWQFLDDCTHALAGQTVPMVPVPDWLVRE